MDTLRDILLCLCGYPPDDASSVVLAACSIGLLVLLLAAALFVEALDVEKYGRWKVPARPYAHMALYLALGGLGGFMSRRLWHGVFIDNAWLRYPALLVLPLVLATITGALAYWRGPKRATRPRLAFWNGCLFGLGWAAMRFAFA